MDIPDVRYTRTGSVSIAYQVVGEGEQTVVYAPHLTSIDALWRHERSAAFLREIAAHARLIVFNPRGTGLSDRPRTVTLESRMDDVVSVMDAVRCERVSLFGVSESANTCALVAATYPERLDHLILFTPWARSVRSGTYPFGSTEEELAGWVLEMRERWGDRDFLEEFGRTIDEAYGEDDELMDWFVWMQRSAVGPAGAADFARLQGETDITDILGSIRVPTLIMYREQQRGASRFVADRIRGAETLELPGQGWDPNFPELADATISFIRGEARPAVPDAVLATVLFTDLTDSTGVAAQLGARAWSELLAAHQSDVRRELGRYRGIEIDTAGDGFFCRFDGPARAIACARVIVDGAGERGLVVRAGIHTGECELVGPKLAGIAVHVGARVQAAAAPGEVLVSSTVRDLVAGSGFSFEDRGEHQLKGIDRSWRLFAAVTEG